MRRRIAVAALPLLALAACAGGDPVAGPTTPPATTTAAPATAPGTVRVVDRKEIGSPGAVSVSGTVFGHWAAWASGPDGRARFDRVVVADLRTGQTRAVARTTTQHIDTVRGHGDTLVYRELSERPDHADTSEWAIKTYDLATGTGTTIARSKRPGTTIPVPAMSDRAIVWIEGEEGDQHLRVHDRTTRTTRTVFRSKVLVTVEIDGSDVFFVDGASEQRAVLTVPLSGGRPTLLIPAAHAILLGVTRTHVAYARGPSAHSDPDGLVVYDRASRESAQVTDSTSSMFALGDGFVVWNPLAEDRYVVAPLRASAPYVVLQPEHANVPLRLSADGDRVIWGESRVTSTSGPAVFTNRIFTARVVPSA